MIFSEPFSVKQESPFFVEDPQIVDGHLGSEITDSALASLKFDFKEQRSTAAVKKSRMTFVSNQPGKAKQAKVDSSHEMVQKARNLKLGLFFLSNISLSERNFCV